MPESRSVGDQIFIRWQGEQLPAVIRRKFQEEYKRQWVYLVELDGGETVEIRTAQIVRKQRQPVEELTPEEFAKRIAAVQKEWTPEERKRRWQGPKAAEWMPPQHKSPRGHRSLDYGE
jgi:hypothetical protein